MCKWIFLQWVFFKMLKKQIPWFFFFFQKILLIFNEVFLQISDFWNRSLWEININVHTILKFILFLYCFPCDRIRSIITFWLTFATVILLLVVSCWYRWVFRAKKTTEDFSRLFFSRWSTNWESTIILIMVPVFIIQWF